MKTNITVTMSFDFYHEDILSYLDVKIKSNSILGYIGNMSNIIQTVETSKPSIIVSKVEILQNQRIDNERPI